MDKITKPETLYLGWYDPRTHKVNHAGVAFYNEQYGEYFLKIDEDSDKQFFLKAYTSEEDTVTYRMEMVIKKKDGRFLKRQCVGEGVCSPKTDGNVHIDYGSKFKTLILFLKD